MARRPVSHRSRVLRVFRASMVLVALLGLRGVGGCTFGDLGGYEIGECDPTIASLAVDPCDRLNALDDGCEIYQCDRNIHRCLLSPRDEDRDGDPSLLCGGEDCDDHDPARSSLHGETCDGKDNNCDQIVDEGVLKPHGSVEIAQTGLLPPYSDIRIAEDGEGGNLAAYVANTAKNGLCLQAVRLVGPNAGFLYEGCSFLADTTTLVPRHPEAHTFPSEMGGGAGVVFVTTSGCSQGRLSYRYTGSGVAGEYNGDCHPAGVALPAWAIGSKTIESNGATSKAPMALVTWYEVSIKDRDPFGMCEDAKPIPAAQLRMATISSPASGSPTLEMVQTPSVSSTSARPAVVVATESPPGFFVASPIEPEMSPLDPGTGPVEPSVGIWFVGPDGAVSSMRQIDSLLGARAAAMAIHAAGSGSIGAAVVAEIGCAPHQAIKLSLGTGTTIEDIVF